jgi:hypothetical protein
MPKAVYLFEEAVILAYGLAMSTEKKREKWKTFFGSEEREWCAKVFTSREYFVRARPTSFHELKTKTLNTENTECAEKARDRET